MKNFKEVEQKQLKAERQSIVEQLDKRLETPMLIHGFVWLCLLIYELICNLTPALELIGTIIWIIFVLGFAVKFPIAPDKTAYLKANWLTVLSLLAQARGVFRIFRVFLFFCAARSPHGLRLFRVLTTLNGRLKALSASFARRGFGFVVALSIIVTFAGAAPMLAFENEVPKGLNSYGGALWWRATLFTTVGSNYFPQAIEGRFCGFGGRSKVLPFSDKSRHRWQHSLSAAMRLTWKPKLSVWKIL